MADIRAILGRLRHGEVISDDHMRAFAFGMASGAVTDAQGAAFAMAVCKGGLSEDETVSLTRGMRDSGDVLHWDLPGPVLDKHSTGGLGDATTLVIAPALAALDCYAPFLSGRGLGHTGGTLDKLESVPGVQTVVSEAKLRRITQAVGCAVVGASTEIAPADRRLYALRDHTSTVDSPELIVASILSKKLAGGAQALILDVKGGSGAFMKTRDEARALAQALVSTARAAGCPTRALITDMNQPLAPAVGNAVEVAEALAVLRGPRPESRLCQLSLALCGELLALAGRVDSPEAGARAALDVLQSGAAAERFERMIHALGGPARLLDHPRCHLPEAPVQIDVSAARDGHIAAVDGVALGEVVQGLGGGRRLPTDSIDPRVGLTRLAGLGDEIKKSQPIARIHAADDASAQAAIGAVRAAMQIGPALDAPPLIHGRID